MRTALPACQVSSSAFLPMLTEPDLLSIILSLKHNKRAGMDGLYIVDLYRNFNH